MRAYCRLAVNKNLAFIITPVSEPLQYTVKPVYWTATQKTLREIRTKVFVEEQGVSPDLEWDGLDEHAYHVIAYAPDGTPVGTGRLLQDSHIGRICVLKDWRGKGIGKSILEMLLVTAHKMGYEKVTLHAQTRVKEFYSRRGFRARGKEFVEAGIAHIAMTRTTADRTAWPSVFPAGYAQDTAARR